jgi:hypothetical protein
MASSRPRQLLGVLVALAAVLPAAGACTAESNTPSGAVAPTASPTGTPVARTTPKAAAAADAVRVVAPLTAVPVDRSPAWPAIAIPVVASSAAPSPQGLDRADVVFEEVTTPTRYVGLFHSQDAARVGPIGRTRPVDPMLLTVVHPAMAYAGGRSGFVQMLHRAPVTDLGYLTKPSAYSRHGSAPYDIFASTTKLRSLVSSSQPPPQLFRFAAGGDSLGRNARPATRVTIRLPDGTGQEWRFDGPSRRWRPVGRSLKAAPANLIIQQVPYKDVRVDKSNAVVPSARIVGEGSGFVLSRGNVVQGRWYKRGAKAITNYVDSAGFPVRLMPGPTWILLAPQGTTVRTAS